MDHGENANSICLTEVVPVNPIDATQESFGCSMKPAALTHPEPHLRYATKDETQKLAHVIGKIPVLVWLVAFTGAAQRFSYYGVTIPWRESSAERVLCHI